MKNGITIIIPCYNTEKYLDKCIESILNQKLNEYEIIMINDCSTDNTKDIINKYISEYKNIKCIDNKENKGAGYSRNIAIKEAKYDLISFVDSDDYLEENYYKELLSSMEKENADLVLCDIMIKYENEEIKSVACQDVVTKENILNTGHAASPCNKLFKKKMLLEYPFPEGIMNEDISTVLTIIIKSNKIAYTNKTYYNYIQREKSVQNSGLTDKRFDIFTALNILEERIKDNEEFNKYWDIIIYQQVISLYLYVPMKEKNFNARYKFIKKLSKYSKKYNIENNKYYKLFLEENGSKYRLYYKSFVNCNNKGLSFLANLMISFYQFYSNKIIKNVIKENITIEDIIEEAKKQKELKSNNIKLSVVVPNYNYEKFMYQRIYSILYQTEKIDELIILDDCSKDNSRELIDELVEKISPYINVKKVYNEENSGTAFKQWRKGFNLATGDYVWIAEADDYSDNKFLREVLNPIKKDQNIRISYVDTAFIDKDGNIQLKSIRDEIDIMKTNHWNSDFVNSGKEEIIKYAFLNCTIANVSSVIFKKENYEEEFELASKYRQAGDWLFYLKVMNKGNISYINKPLNYYRVHGNNVTSLTKKQQHLDEIKKVHNEVNKMYELNSFQKEEINKRYKYLKEVWKLDN